MLQANFLSCSIPADGEYNYSSAIQLIIDNNKLAENEGAISLLKGYHKIKIKNIYAAPVPGVHRSRIPEIHVFMIAPGTADKKPVTADMLYNF